jgi:hypothetical protein
MNLAPGRRHAGAISRTVDRFRPVDEAMVSFTHDRELPWLLPGTGPTHRQAEVRARTWPEPSAPGHLGRPAGGSRRGPVYLIVRSVRK